MRVLVTGGAGYIGAHVVDSLRRRGDSVIVVDDLSGGRASRVPGVLVERVDLADPASVEKLAAALRGNEVEAVVHLAARKQVAESVSRPAWYYQQNVGALANVLLAMESAEVRDIVFSSSAAVYGTTEGATIAESDPAEPVNPYGATKLVGEELLGRAANAVGLRAASLRYFNVGGTESTLLSDDSGTNLVPMVFERLDAGASPLIFGDDYPTPDGTCVRDFVHVVDLAEAHIAAVEMVRRSAPGHSVFNVGTGQGTSVREMIDAILEVSGSDAVPEVVPRREGDPAWVVADPARFEHATGWSARRGVREVVSSAWQAHVATVPAR